MLLPFSVLFLFLDIILSVYTVIKQCKYIQELVLLTLNDISPLQLMDIVSGYAVGMIEQYYSFVTQTQSTWKFHDSNINS